MSTAFEDFRRDVDFMWRKATSLATTQLVVRGRLQREELAMLTLQMFHYVKYTVPVFEEALAKAPRGEEHAPLRMMLSYFASDEAGHDKVALRDLEALGYDPRTCMETLPLPATLALHGTNRLAIAEYGPYYLVGETYATETVGAEMSAAIHAALSGDAELRRGIHFYDVHGEADVRHAEKSVEVLKIALERPENRRPIVLGCLAAWRNLSLLAADVFEARLYPAEFQLPPRRT
jgi:pyrroloquinoline quinone (PQQ) biosynthesis protein C